MGVRPARLLWPRSPAEVVAFWSVWVLAYLAVFAFATARGIGYVERPDFATRTIAFELNSFLWLPDLFGSDPGASPVPVLLWWVLLAGLVAETSLTVVHLLHRGSHSRVGAADRAKKPRSS